jgi:hypothetical protein
MPNMNDNRKEASADAELAELEQLWIAMMAIPVECDAASEAQGKGLAAIETRMFETPAQTAIGLAVKLRMALRLDAGLPRGALPPIGEAYKQGEHLEEQWVLISAMADAERLAGSGS